METRANHFLVGVFTLAGFALLLGGVWWTAKYATDAAWTDYEVRFTQAVTGLTVGGTVQYNGINVGTVRELYLAPDDPRQVVARIRIEADAPVREDTRARLALAGLTGITMIQLRGGSPDSPSLRAEEGELPRIPEERSPLQQVLETSEDIASAASEVLVRLMEFLTEENATRIASTLDNLERASGALVTDDRLLEDTLRSANEAASAVARMTGELEQTMARVDRTLESVGGTLEEDLPVLSAELKSTLGSLAGVAERADRILAANEDAFATFGPEGLAQLGPTLLEMRMVLREFSRLGQRFERSPARFILGGDQPEEYQPR